MSLDKVDTDVSHKSPSFEFKVESPIKKLKVFKKLTEKTQQGDATIRAAQVYFETILKNYHTLSCQLYAAVPAEFNLLFEFWLLKV